MLRKKGGLMCIMYLSRCTRLVVSAALRVKTRYPSTGYPADVQWITSFPTCSTCFGRQNVSHSLQWRDEPGLDAYSTSPSNHKRSLCTVQTCINNLTYIEISAKISYYASTKLILCRFQQLFG